MAELQYDFFGKMEGSGFCLKRFELFNWGTFHDKIWIFTPNSHNSLVTGDIGSGKSSLVDAITTLIVPNRRIVYNKAAGATRQERDIFTYIRGAYKTESGNDGNEEKKKYLRKSGAFSVILGVFESAESWQTITLAQAFRYRQDSSNNNNGRGSLQKIFVIAEQELNIAEHFLTGEGDLKILKRWLRQQSKIEVFEVFKEYCTRFRRLLGLRNEQALDLFYQTVSMKSVGNLTDFVRQHMLEKSEVPEKIDDLCNNFEDLNRLHEAVIKAENQINLLRPIHQNSDILTSLETQKSAWVDGRDEGLYAYFGKKTIDLCEKRKQVLVKEEQNLNLKLSQKKEELANQRNNERLIRQNIDENGGKYIQELEVKIERLVKDRNQRSSRFAKFQEQAQILELSAPKTPKSFVDNQMTLSNLAQEIKEHLTELDEQLVNAGIKVQKLRDHEQQIQEDIKLLIRKKSNIRPTLLKIRQTMTEALNLDEERLPFVGELLQVKESEKVWEGAIERVLHSFGLSLLVPEEEYHQISHYVEKTHLRGKLVYFRVQNSKQRTYQTTEQQSLVHKLDIKPGTNFSEWLRHELSINFDYICCTDMQKFYRLPKAITVAGQIKSGGRRHEKDDRHHLNDRSRFILGWNVKEKIQALKDLLSQIQKEGVDSFEQQQQIKNTVIQLRSKDKACSYLTNTDDFADIDWFSLAAKIEELKAEKQQLEESSDTLKDLHSQLVEIQNNITSLENTIEKLIGQIKECEVEIKQNKEIKHRAFEDLEQLSEEKRKNIFSFLEQQAIKWGVLNKLSLYNVHKRQTEMRTKMQMEIDNLSKRISRIREKIVHSMKDFCHLYPEDTTQMDAVIESLDEFVMFWVKLKDEDLPRHKQRFKSKMDQDTINGMAMFQNQLDQEKRHIEEKIAIINNSLHQIDYTKGSFIRIHLASSKDTEVSLFRGSIRQILADTLDPETVYTEQKFLQVKAIIDRFKGREKYSDADKRWTEKVTDVRNWFTFAVSERWREDSSEKEYYPDSGGKSGGQKEKLAYTILASALVYQFGLAEDGSLSRSFRFVVIDEAFGRGSDDSTRYGLELFKKLGMQLLVVTPLQKIHVIENYVENVHFIHNEDGQNSMIRNLTIQEYQKEKEQFLMEKVKVIPWKKEEQRKGVQDRL